MAINFRQISGNELMERWEMDEYEIAQLILNESLKVLDSYNLHAEFIFE